MEENMANIGGSEKDVNMFILFPLLRILIILQLKK
jgi:hypothetical protein